MNALFPVTTLEHLTAAVDAPHAFHELWLTECTSRFLTVPEHEISQGYCPTMSQSPRLTHWLPVVRSCDSLKVKCRSYVCDVGRGDDNFRDIKFKVSNGGL